MSVQVADFRKEFGGTVKRNLFSGGIHPPDEKRMTADCPFEEMPLPDQVVLPLSQHSGKPAKPLVKKGDEVRRGCLIAEADGILSAPIHSPINGRVLKIGRHPSSSGFPGDAITIQSDHGTSSMVLFPPLDPERVRPEGIRERVRQAGIVGLGGAAFPTAVKLTPPEGQPIDLLILNGCECEPYLTRDARFMVERPYDLVSGLRLMMKAAGCGKAVIGIEDNKPEAVQSIRGALRDQQDIQIVVVKTRYPQGAEKQLIRSITGKSVPPGKLPLHLGMIVANAATAAAVHDAVYKGMPCITAAVTVSGHGIRDPKNLIVPVGTSLHAVMAYCGGMTEETARVVVGGPMMGSAQYDLNAPVIKATSAILFLTQREIDRNKETACLKCGKCVDVCPMNLVPTRLARLVQAGYGDDAGTLGIMSCMECGACAYVCPAHVPLVQWLQLGKQKVKP
jgi:electron transport complex protein RnfC